LGTALVSSLHLRGAICAALARSSFSENWIQTPDMTP
jgi:hypothetical protein